MRTQLLSLVLVLFAPVLSLAQVLSDRVPDDAVVFVGWRGSDDMGPGYAGSNLKKILDASNIPQLINQSIPNVINRFGEREPQARVVLDMIGAIGGPMWRHPSALYFGGVDFTNPRQPMPKLAIICDAKGEAQAMLAQVQQALARAGRGVPVRASTSGTFVIVEMGRTQIATTVEGKGGASLAQNPQFKQALSRTQTDPVFTVYINSEKLIGLIDEGIAKTGRPNEQQEWARISEGLGVRTFKYGVWTGGFMENNWSMQAFVAAPAPRTGLMTLFDAKPLSKEALSAVPSTATMCVAGQLDLAAVFTEIQSSLGKVDPKTQQEFNTAIEQNINQPLQMDLVKDVLQPLGSEWVLYVDPTIGGNGILGATVVNRLRNPAKAEESLTKLEGMANAILSSITGQGRDPVTIAFKQSKIGDSTIHYLAVPFVTPAWTVRDGNLYAALYPQVASSAAEHVASKGKSILENKDFNALLQRLGQTAPASVSFHDLPKTASEGYQMLLALSRLYLGLGDMFGLDSPPMVIPPLNKILPTLSPAGSVSWSDAEGWHSKSISPFPGSVMLGSGGSMAAMSTGQSALLVSILLPSLNRARETANRVKCASNLRQIGQGCMLFANDNRGRFPNDLAELHKTQDTAIEAFVCPSGDVDLPPDIHQMNRDQQAAWILTNSSYVYLGKGKANAMAADGILAYEKDGAHDGDGMNILYGDGHVEFHSRMNALQELKRVGVLKDGPDPGL